ncbi:LOW QUALITY PROTEIN: olfactory receptor 52R1-like [Chelonoidis abingdonii]|uniref:LOW QUALITY PROTEIN: olfactory receptor 52R1-like n=1 Tax=Chelonoidis abingdonii TaxID=106734 RepID=UPI003F495A19
MFSSPKYGSCTFSVSWSALGLRLIQPGSLKEMLPELGSDSLGEELAGEVEAGGNLGSNDHEMCLILTIVSPSRHLYCDRHPRPWAHTQGLMNVVYLQDTSFSLRVGHLLPYSISDSNKTHFTNPSTFILLGIPGLEAAHVWISIPFCAIYILAILGNFTILFMVKTEPSLHGPMYYFLCMLAVTDLVLSTSILPKMLSIFWFNSREIDFSACLTQLYFIPCFLVVESGIFMAMALDRYVAICNPLRHSTTLQNSVVAKIGLAVVLLGGMIILPSFLLVSQWPYCRTNIIPHSYCEHMAVMKLACADTRVSSYYGLFVLFFVTGVDVFFITVSYIQILRAIFSLPTKDARLKTFGTCGFHLFAILAFYIPALFSFLTYCFDHNVPLHFHVLTANVYILMPPMINPIIYGVRTKQIRDRLLRLITHKGTTFFSCCSGSQPKFCADLGGELVLLPFPESLTDQ